MPDQNWQFELEEYIKQGEPDRVTAVQFTGTLRISPEGRRTRA